MGEENRPGDENPIPDQSGNDDTSRPPTSEPVLKETETPPTSMPTLRYIVPNVTDDKEDKKGK